MARGGQQSRASSVGLSILQRISARQPRGPSGAESDSAPGRTRVDLRWTWAGHAVLALTSVLMAVTVWDYGIIWDEEFHSIYGEYVLAWFQSGFRNEAALGYKNLFLYGGFFDLLAQLVAHASPLGLYEDRHLVNVAFAILALVGTRRLGQTLLGTRGGVLAMLLTALTPMFYGHSFNNPKDIPFAAVSVWTLYYTFESARPLPSIAKGTIAKLAISFGILLAIRPGGIFFFGYIVLWWCLALWRRGGTTPSVRHPAAALALVLLSGWVLMVSFWPWAQGSPILNPLRGMKNAARFSFVGTTLFFGKQVPARPAPATYLPTWFGLQLPETYFVASAAAVAAYAFRRRYTDSEAPRRSEATVAGAAARFIRNDNVALSFLGFVVLFPMATAIILRATLYDAVRHFLFVLPPLAVLAAAAIESGLGPPVPRAVRALIACAVTATAALTVCDMVALHPYQSVYFNRLFAGGLAGAEGRFETDYWGNGYREAVEWVMQHVEGEGIRLANCCVPVAKRLLLAWPVGRALYAGAPRSQA